MSCLDIPWWPGYMERIKILCPFIYEKELRREEKARYGKPDSISTTYKESTQGNEDKRET